MTPEQIKKIIADQQEHALLPKDYFKRSAEAELLPWMQNNEIIVLTGIRRAGKSVIMQQLRAISREKDYYFNFEDERIVAFELADFQLLYEVFLELFGVQKTFYFDEIQNIPGWEKFVRRLYNNGNKIYITGSNANLFSEELGTRLTGRYMEKAIYPISFYEFTKHQVPSLIGKKLLTTEESSKLKSIFSDYYITGGFPEYIKFQQTDYLQFLYESIIYKDIIVRYKLQRDDSIKKLVFYLASNCSKETTYNALKKALGAGSVTTISNYCHYLENSYLCFFVNRYHDSVKTQLQSPKKVYFIDHTLARIIGFRFSEDRGRILENIVYIALRENYEVFYHSSLKECDFIARKHNKIIAAIQVCQSLTDTPVKQREIAGLLEALVQYELDEGTILTEHEEYTEIIQHHDKNYSIMVLPIWKWLLFYANPQ